VNVTEQEWLTGTNLYALTEFLRTRHHANRTKAGRRKLRLVGCACCRYAWHLFADEPECSALVLEAERFADAGGNRRRLARLDAALPVPQSAGLGFHLFAVHAARFVADSNVVIASLAVAQTVAQGLRHVAAHSAVSELTDDRQAAILRDIFGNPFRPVAFSTEWRTDTAVTLARQLYESGNFSAMPILADALQDAGCDNDDVLNHCRDANQLHVRGCWIVDLLLGKE
jgi:hypothetical protein